MLKLRIALCLALIVGSLTLINGVVYGARTMTVLYRVIISVVIFAFLGYGLGIIIEKFLQRIINDKTEEEQQVIQEETIAEVPIEAEFNPFTSDNFEQISRPEE